MIILALYLDFLETKEFYSLNIDHVYLDTFLICI